MIVSDTIVKDYGLGGINVDENINTDGKPNILRIYNLSGSGSYTDFQVSLNGFSQNIYLQQESNILPYYYFNKEDKVWFKLSFTTSTRLFLFSPKEDNSNADNVFEIFDDFNSSTLDTSKWSIDSDVSYSISNSILTVSLIGGSSGQYHGLHSANMLNDNTIMVIKVRAVFDETYDQVGIHTWASSTLYSGDYRYTNYYLHKYSGTEKVMYKSGDGNYYDLINPYDDSKWTIGTLYMKNGTSRLVINYDGSDYDSGDFTPLNSGDYYIKIVTFWEWAYTDGKIDYIYVRKYNSTEPSSTLIGLRRI